MQQSIFKRKRPQNDNIAVAPSGRVFDFEIMRVFHVFVGTLYKPEDCGTQNRKMDRPKSDQNSVFPEKTFFCCIFLSGNSAYQCSQPQVWRSLGRVVFVSHDRTDRHRDSNNTTHILITSSEVGTTKTITFYNITYR